jgi:hypothetical protein
MSREVYLWIDCGAHGRHVDFEHCLCGVEHISSAHWGGSGRILNSGKAAERDEKAPL